VAGDDTVLVVASEKPGGAVVADRLAEIAGLDLPSPQRREAGVSPATNQRSSRARGR